MPTNALFEPTKLPLVDRTVNSLNGQRAVLKRKQAVAFSVACVLFVGAIILLLVLAAFLGQSPYVVAGFAALAAVSVIFAAAGTYFHMQFSRLRTPLTLAENVRKGLINEGFYYDNHREFFGKYWVFHESDGGRIAIVDTRSPFDPIIADAGSHLTLKLDGAFAFVGKVGERQPQLADFIRFPDYRYKNKKELNYIEAEFFTSNGTKRVFNLEFPFRNALRKQFLSLISYIC